MADAENDDEEGGLGKRLLPAGRRMPLLITILLVGTVGGAYYNYYRKQTDYFTGRNLRILSMMTAQIDGRIEMFKDFGLRGSGSGSKNGIELSNCSGATGQASDPFDVLRGIDETSRGRRLALARAGTPCVATVSLDQVLNPIFARRVGTAFDMLLIADTNGNVLYSIRPPPSSSTLLGHEEEWIDQPEEPPPASEECPEPVTANKRSSASRPDGAASSAAADRESGSVLLISNLKALSERKGWGEPPPLNLDRLSSATSSTKVMLEGNDYVLFTQPYNFASENASRDHKRHQWIVCGLVSAPRFRFEVSAVSTSIIMAAIAVALLALCCWPFLRIALIGPSQAMTITDVVLIVICTIVGVTAITLALLAGFSYRSVSRMADDQLEQFSEQVNQDFGKDVGRAAIALDAVESLTSPRAVELASQKSAPLTELLPCVLRNDPKVAQYPYIDSIAWIGDDGMQLARFSRIAGPLFAVGDRAYFQLARMNRTWTVAGHSYVLEWVRSKSTGEVRAVLAKKTEVKPFAVVSLATELIDVSHAVPPPGVEMAIIDENGEVVYHSDTERIGYENFFAEADRDRDLRSAVLARRAVHVSAKYWGEEDSMYVRPLAGSAWTLVTFRSKRLTDILTVEGALLTLMLLLVCAVPYFLLYVAVLLLFPRYRAPRLWPDVSRTCDYLRLSVVLVALLLLFSLNIYALAPWESVCGTLIIPVLAIVTTYLVLHRTGAPRRYNIGTAVWIAVNALLICCGVQARVDPLSFLSPYSLTVKAVLVIAVLATAVITQVLLSGSGGGAGLAEGLRRLSCRIGYSRLYRLCGVLLLAIGVVMPVLGFFRISRRMESELLVKYTQLRAAADLEHRIDHLETLNALPSSSPKVYEDLLCTPLGFLFQSEWGLRPSVSPPPSCAGPRKSAASCNLDHPHGAQPTIPLPVAASLPALYEDSIAIRPLFEGQSIDDLWTWCLNGSLITLVRKVRFDRDVAHLVWGGHEDPAQEKIFIDSSLPRASAAATWAYAGLGILVAVPLLAVCWLAATFIARRLLLIEVSEPDWLVPLPLSPSLGEHIFLVRRDRDAFALTGNDPTGNGLPFLEVSFEDLDRNDRWLAMLERLDSSEAGRNVRAVDFEYGINDGAVNERKLQWLERLQLLPDRTVIIVSAVTQAYVMTTPPPSALPVGGGLTYFERWRALFERFVCITAEELELRHDEWLRRQKFRTVSQLNASEPKTWLEKETAHNSFLRQLAKEIEGEEKARRDEGRFDARADREHLLDEIGERAETYYAGLWASCHGDEKLLLCQLAHNGLANSANRRLLRRLMARGLVRREPNLELFSETFRLYVLGAARREDIVGRAHAQRPASTWDSLRVPFFIVIISFLILLFATQKDLLTTTGALATALTTGLPIIMKLLGMFTERRTGGTSSL